MDLKWISGIILVPASGFLVHFLVDFWGYPGSGRCKSAKKCLRGTYQGRSEAYMQKSTMMVNTYDGHNTAVFVSTRRYRLTE